MLFESVLLSGFPFGMLKYGELYLLEIYGDFRCWDLWDANWTHE